MREIPQAGVRWDDEVLSLIGLIYDAADDASCWPLVLERVAQAVNCEGITILPSTSDSAVPSISNPARTGREDLALYEDYYQSPNILAEACDAPFPAGTVRYRHWSARNSDSGKSEVCSTCDLGQKICCGFGLKVPLSHQPGVYLSCIRRRENGHFMDADGIVFKTLMPHLQRAFRLYLDCERAKSNTRELKCVLDTFDRAVFGLNRKGIVILSNRQAKAIIEKADGLELTGGRLVAGSSWDDFQLQSHIARSVAASAGDGTSHSVSFHLSRNSESLPLQITITPFASAVPSNEGQLAALVFVSDPAQKPESCSVLLRQLYGLSPTECRLADLLHEGLEVREAACRLKATLETTRFHLKRVLAKTSTRRQTELMRLMLSLPPGYSNACSL
jgi:DNA-binding CsgD family transcriptional regulator